jgi:flagellar assembly protein FliH
MSLPEAPPNPHEEAQEILQAAQHAADALLATTRQEAERLLREVRDAGYAAGQEEGRRELDDARDRLAQMEIDLLHEQDAFYMQAEAEVVRLAMAIAEKVLAQELETHSALLVEMARAELLRVRDREVVHIRVHPDDLPVLQEARPHLLNTVEGIRELHFIEDRRVGRGGLVYETPSGALDARLSSKLAIIQRGLEDALESRDGAHL